MLTEPILESYKEIKLPQRFSPSLPWPHACKVTSLPISVCLLHAPFLTNRILHTSYSSHRASTCQIPNSTPGHSASGLELNDLLSLGFKFQFLTVRTDTSRSHSYIRSRLLASQQGLVNLGQAPKSLAVDG